MEVLIIYYVLVSVIGFAVLWFVVYHAVKTALRDKGSQKEDEILKTLENIFIQVGGNKFKYEEIDQEVKTEIEDKYKDQQKVNAYNTAYFSADVRKKLDLEIEQEGINRKIKAAKL